MFNKYKKKTASYERVLRHFHNAMGNVEYLKNVNADTFRLM